MIFKKTKTPFSLGFGFDYLPGRMSTNLSIISKISPIPMTIQAITNMNFLSLFILENNSTSNKTCQEATQKPPFGD